ncbi:hypothetical protein N9U55_01885 [Luminiphilus sp.]|nr:hypothetical protein [Luminiphilus sp.]MDA9722014.1 hypothetical protein [Luminiphilus sp.]
MSRHRSIEAPKSDRKYSAKVEVFTNHWDPFFVGIAGKYGLSEQMR